MHSYHITPSGLAGSLLQEPVANFAFASKPISRKLGTYAIHTLLKCVPASVDFLFRFPLIAWFSPQPPGCRTKHERAHPHVGAGLVTTSFFLRSTYVRLVLFAAWQLQRQQQYLPYIDVRTYRTSALMSKQADELLLQLLKWGFS